MKFVSTALALMATCMTSTAKQINFRFKEN